MLRLLALLPLLSAPPHQRTALSARLRLADLPLSTVAGHGSRAATLRRLCLLPDCRRMGTRHCKTQKGNWCGQCNGGRRRIMSIVVFALSTLCPAILGYPASSKKKLHKGRAVFRCVMLRSRSRLQLRCCHFATLRATPLHSARSLLRLEAKRSCGGTLTTILLRCPCMSVPPHQRTALSARWRLLAAEQQHWAAGTRGRSGPSSISRVETAHCCAIPP